MALSRSRIGEVPKDAVILNEDQALTYQWKIISNWDNLWDVWALRHSTGVLGGLAAISGIYVNSHYRGKLRLGNYGKLSTYLPIVVIPAMFSMLTHRFFVQRPIMLGKVEAGCPLCYQVRAAAFQGGVGVVYPTLLAPFAAFMFATRHFTYRLPSITAEPLEVLQLYRRMTKPILPALAMLLATHSLVAMFLTYKATEQNYMLRIKLAKLEQQQLDAEQPLLDASHIDF